MSNGDIGKGRFKVKPCVVKVTAFKKIDGTIRWEIHSPDEQGYRQFVSTKELVARFNPDSKDSRALLKKVQEMEKANGS